MIAGQLEIQLLANVARLQSDMNQAKSTVSTAMRDMGRSVEQFKSLLGTLGVTLSAGFFAELIKGSIDAMEHLGNLSKSTNITIETLGGLSVVAKQTGGDVDSMADSILKLSVNMGKAPERFKALGLSAKDPLENFKKLADIFVAIQDPEQRNAVMAEALGKSWKGAAPALALGSKALGEMIDRGTELSGVTAAGAAMAEEFNRKWIELVGTGGLLTKLVTPLLPLLITVADDMIKARDSSDKLESSFHPLLEIGKVVTVLFGNVSFVLKTIGNDLGRLAAAFTAFATGDFKRAYDLMFSPDIGKEDDARRAAFDTWEAGIMAIGTASAAATPPIAGMADAQKAAAAAAAAAAKAFLDYQKNQALVAEAAKAGEKMLEGLQKEYLKLNDQTKQDETLQRALLELQEKRFAMLDPKIKQQILDQAKLNDAKSKELATTQFLLELNKEEMAAADKRNQDIEDLANAWADATDALREEAKLLGLSNVDRQKAVLLEKARLDIIAASGNAAAIRDINAQLQEQLAILTQIDNFHAWEHWAEAAGNFFGDLAVNGKKAFTDLRQFVKQLIQDMIALFAKRWILQLAAGGSMAGAAGGALASDGSSLASSALSLGGSALGGASSYLFGSTATTATGLTEVSGGALGSGGFAATLGTWVGQAAVAFGAEAATGTAISLAVAEAIPYIGWIIAIGSVLYQAFGHKGGGPKVGGSFLGSFDSSGTGTDITSTLDRGRYLNDETQIDRQMATVTSSVAAGFFAALKGLGGTTTGIQFGMGSNMDPAGTAQSQASGLVRDASGRVLFDQHIDAGRTSEELATGLNLEAQRAILVALQASTLPKEIANIIDSLVAESATADQINQVLAAALDMKNVLDHLGDINLKGLDVAAVQAWQQGGETLSQTLARIGGAIAAFDNKFMTDAQKLVVAQQQVNAVFAQFGVTVPASTQAFYELVHSIDVSTEAGRAFLVALLGIQDAFLLTVQTTDTVTQTTTDATTAVQSFSDTIGTLTTSIRYYDQTWIDEVRKYTSSLFTNSALSPLGPLDQLAAARAQYEKLLAATNAGDTNAGHLVSGAADEYLKLARQIFGSTSSYVDIFKTVVDQLSGLIGDPDYNAQMLALQRDHVDIAHQQAATLVDVRSILLDIRDGTKTSTAEPAPLGNR